MKKRGYFIFFVLLSLISFASAQFSDEMDSIVQAGDSMVNSESPSDYLKSEWSKLIENSWVKGYLETVSSFISKIDPLFEIVLGVKFSFSWFFLFTLCIYLFLIIFTFHLLLICKRISEEYGKYFRWIGFLLFLVSFSTIRMPMHLSSYLVKFIEMFKELSIQILLSLLIVILLIMLIAFSKDLSNSIMESIWKKHFKELDKKIEKQRKKMNELEKSSKEKEQKNKYQDKEEEEKEAEEEARNELEDLT